MPAPALLYLDTARLGQMSPMAQRLSTAFIRLSAEEPFSLYFEQFMRNGFASWPDSYQRRFPDLSTWGGIESVKNDIRGVVGVCKETPVILASRSLWLVRCAARTAFKNCGSILTTDLSWPSYEAILRSESQRVGGNTFQVSISEGILNGSLSEGDVIESITAAFVNNRCDGLFLPAVSNLGIRMPIERIIRAIESRATLQFVLTDAAQAIGHVPLDSVCESSDFVVAGCHKWVRAYHPLGIGIIGRQRYASEIADGLIAHRSDDALFDFLDFLESGRLSDHLETVNLAPLFSCQGALRELGGLDTAALAQRLRNGKLVRELAEHLGWHPIIIAEPLRSGIQLLKLPRGADLLITARAVHDAGVRGTSYDTGLLRLSIPTTALTFEDCERLRTALSRTTPIAPVTWSQRISSA